MNHNNERLISSRCFCMLKGTCVASKQEWHFHSGMKKLHSLSEALCLVCNITAEDH